MNAFGFLFTLIMGALLYQLPRRWAAVPFLIGAAYMTRGQELELGPLHFPVIRILVVVGFARVLAKGERLAGGVNRLDRLIIGWAIWMVVAGFFHTTDGVVLRLGIVWSSLGSYFLFRVFVREIEDIRRLFQALCIIMVPVGAAMLAEKITGRNSFAALGGVWAEAALRHGKFRAQGPFAHAILAGSVGAMCFPMALLLWREHRKTALAGLAASGAMVYASGSSGPAMMVFSILGAMALWKVQTKLRAIRWLAVFAIIGLDLVMNDPVYFLLARIDITGGSTGWHRAELIQSAFAHLGEWWAVGTDRTRHWMPTGIHANDYHTDITNFYLQMGVWGGLLLLFLFMANLYAAFSAIGKSLRTNAAAPVQARFLVWTVGAILFGHAANFFSISYFDQSVVFLYLVFAFAGSLTAMRFTAVREAQPDPTLPNS